MVFKIWKIHRFLLNIQINMQDVYKNIEEYNTSRKRNVLIVFNDMIPNTINNEKVVVTELLIRGRKLNISTIFITQSYFQVPKEVTIQITFNHLSDMEFEDLMNLCKKWLCYYHVWLNGWVFIYELSGYGFKSRCCHFAKNVLQHHFLF